MSAELAVQIAIRARLSSTAGVTALVPAANILDRNERPNPDPSIILGEDQSVDEGGTIARDLLRVYSTLHVWKKGPSLAGVKAIAWAIRSALRSGRMELGSGFHCVDCRVSSQRYLRDPDGLTSHAVITIETQVKEIT